MHLDWRCVGFFSFFRFCWVGLCDYYFCIFFSFFFFSWRRSFLYWPCAGGLFCMLRFACCCILFCFDIADCFLCGVFCMHVCEFVCFFDGCLFCICLEIHGCVFLLLLLSPDPLVFGFFRPSSASTCLSFTLEPPPHPPR